MLSAEQIAARKGKLTASRVGVLMTGDKAGTLRLFHELLGEAEPENLDHVWRVQLGIATEQLNREWYERKNNVLLVRVGEVVVHPLYPWACCTLDGWDDRLSCPFEAKHVSGREPLEVIIERYQPQVQFQLLCTGASQCALSVIMGANEPVVEYVERDDEYGAEMIKRGEQFMRFVEMRVPPVVLDAVPAPTMATQIYHMEGNNKWADNAAIWLQNKDAADACEAASRVLKSVVPDDAKKCDGHGIQITRDRAGRLSLRRA